MGFQASIVDAKDLGNNRYALTSGVEWGILIDNQTQESILIRVMINNKYVPFNWSFGAEQKGTLEKPGNMRHYFTFKAPMKTGTSKYTKVVIRAENESGKIIGAANISLVDIRDPQTRS